MPTPFKMAKDFWELIVRTRKRGSPTGVLVLCDSPEIAHLISTEVRRMTGVDSCYVAPASMFRVEDDKGAVHRVS